MERINFIYLKEDIKMKIENMLRDEIQSEIEELGKIELGSEQYKTTVEAVTKLMDRVIEMEKIDIEHQERIETRDEENQFKMEQMKEDRKDRIIKNILSAAGIIIPVGVTIWGTKISLKFEEEGTITTTAGRNFINKLFPKK